MGLCRKLAATYVAAGVAILAVGAGGLFAWAPRNSGLGAFHSIRYLGLGLSIGTPVLTALILSIGLISVRKLRARAAGLVASSSSVVSPAAGDELDQLTSAHRELCQANAQFRVRQDDYQRLAEAQRFIDSIFHSMFDIVIVVDPKELVVTKVNRAACELLGYTDLELIGRHVRTLFYQEHYVLCPPVEVRLRNNDTRDGEMTYLTASGQCISALVSASTMCDASGQPIAIVTVGKDITSRKRIENDLVESRHQAESDHRAKTELLDDLRQQIQTSMTAVLGCVELLTSPKLTGGQRENCVRTIRQAGQHLLQSIKGTSAQCPSDPAPDECALSNKLATVQKTVEGLIQLCETPQAETPVESPDLVHCSDLDYSDPFTSVHQFV